MLTAIYAHIFEKELWKKVVLLAFSVLFAVIANAGPHFHHHTDSQGRIPRAGGRHLPRIFRVHFLPDRARCDVSLSQAAQCSFPQETWNRIGGHSFAMTIRRLLLLQGLLLVGMGSVFLLPAQSHNQPAGVNMNLPDFIGSWFGVPQKVTQAELDELAADTTFARRVYSNGLGDSILVSIVLAGQDPDNSLHRPERCLPAQGWTIIDSKVITIDAPTLPNGKLKVTRLYNQQKFPDAKGDVRTVYNLNYYWFIGYHDVTPSAIHRAVFDIRDRVVKGYDQRWAYVTVAATITKGEIRFGRSEQETDKLIQDFIAQLFPAIAKRTVQVAMKGTGD